MDTLLNTYLESLYDDTLLYQPKRGFDPCVEKLRDYSHTLRHLRGDVKRITVEGERLFEIKSRVSAEPYYYLKHVGYPPKRLMKGYRQPDNGKRTFVGYGHKYYRDDYSGKSSRARMRLKTEFWREAYDSLN
jgi:hypothetical protein